MKALPIILTILALVITACTTLPPTPPITPGDDPELDSTELQRFSSLEEFQAVFAGSSDSNGGFGQQIMRSLSASADMSVAESAPKAESSYSTTNVQVQGIDEGDIIKTDGEYIYTSSGNTVYIVKAGAESEIVSTIKLDNQISGLFLNGDKLAVYGNLGDNEYYEEHDLSPRIGLTFFTIYDISNRANPSEEKMFAFEGRFFESRMTDDDVYFVTITSPGYRAMPTPYIIEGNNIRNMPVNDIFFAPSLFSNPQLATVHAININSNKLTDSTSVTVEYDQNLYMSFDNLFVTYSRSINTWQLRQTIMIELLQNKLTTSDKMLVQKIKATDSDVLSPGEKQSRISNIMNSYYYYLPEHEQKSLDEKIDQRLKAELDSYDHLEFTIIHRLSIDEGQVKVKADGKVPGRVLNQFSMDEYDGVFRIATTVGQQWQWFRTIEAPERALSQNMIYTLDENLNVLDSIEGLAEGERIFSARFIADKLYLVTFRQVDPFFVIDLSDPNNIEQLGELKIPGFSRYLHPYDENTIIGIGRDATEMGRQQGLKISLFDVTDVANPRELVSFVAEQKWSGSTAEYEHKAFLFDREKELLVIPAYSYSQDDSYNGAWVFHIDREDITLRGIIDHGSGSRYYRALVERSLYIDDLLYTKSPDLLRVNSLDDLSAIARVTLAAQDDPLVIY